MRLSFAILHLSALAAAAILPQEDPTPTTSVAATSTATTEPHACACNAATNDWACTNTTTGAIQDFPGRSCDDLPPEMTFAECSARGDEVWCDASDDPVNGVTGPWACMLIEGSGITTIYWWPNYMCTSSEFNEPPPDSISAVQG